MRACGEQKARGGFVGAALDGARAVDERNAERAERMQHAEPQRDRLQRAVADRAHDGGVRQRAVEARNGEACARVVSILQARRRTGVARAP